MDENRHLRWNAQKKLRAPAGSVVIAGGQPVPIERNSSMRPDPILAALIAGTETPGSKDRNVLHFTGTLHSQWIAPKAGGRSAPPSNPASDALTARERDILAMICQGLSNKRTARALKISPETVKSHVKRIFSKLAVSTRSAAVFRAGSLGLLRLPELTPKENAIASSEG